MLVMVGSTFREMAGWIYQESINYLNKEAKI